jgi:hypothetical protein
LRCPGDARIDQINSVSDVASQLRELREWVNALTRRIEELESTAFQLADEEEVLLIVVPKS